MTIVRLLWQIPLAFTILLLIFFFTNEYAQAWPSHRTKDIAYKSATAPDFDPERHVLDVYAPRKKRQVPYPVVVFIHGGNWDSGSKNLYTFIGRRLARQGIVAVILNYRLSPSVLVPAMADDCTEAVRWVSQHIAEYGGNPDRIFLMGHSAGGGLAALLATDNRLFAKHGMNQNPVKGAILDDPAGLDMFDYLKKMAYPNDQQYLVAFGKNETVWRDMSAMYHLGAHTPPILIYVGERTYPSIASSSRRFREKLKALGLQHEFKVLPGKKHVGMVTQLYWKNNVIYRELLPFIGQKND